MFLFALVPLAAADGLCGSKTPPTGYRTAVGYGSGTRAVALEAARQQAIDRAIELYAGQLTALQEAAFRREVFDWSEDHWAPGSAFQPGSACFKLAIGDGAFYAHEAQIEQLRRALGAVADLVRARTGAAEVEAPVWDDSGCVADIGAALRTTLVAELRGVKDQAGAPRLATRLSAFSDTVSAAVTLDGESLGGFSFPLWLFRNEAGETGRCAGNTKLGLARDDRPGASGLAVRVQLTGHGGEACEGDPEAPSVTTSARSRVQVFSLDAQALGHYVGTWDVSGTVSLGSGTLTPMPGGGDERLVAVALPPGSSFGPTDHWGGYCKLAAPIHVSAFPADAAIGTATFIVRPSGTRGCPVVPPAAADAAHDAPACR